MAVQARKRHYTGPVHPAVALEPVFNIIEGNALLGDFDDAVLTAAQEERSVLVDDPAVPQEEASPRRAYEGRHHDQAVTMRMIDGNCNSFHRLPNSLRRGPSPLLPGNDTCFGGPEQFNRGLTNGSPPPLNRPL